MSASSFCPCEGASRRRRRLAALTAELSPCPCSPVTAGPHPPPAPRGLGRAPPGRAVPPWPRFPPRGARGPATEAGADKLPAAEPQPLGVGSRVSWRPHRPVLTHCWGPVRTHGGGSGRPFPPAQPDCPLPLRPLRRRAPGLTRRGRPPATTGRTPAAPPLLPGFPAREGAGQISHECGPAKSWKEPEGKVPEAARACRTVGWAAEGNGKGPRGGDRRGARAGQEQLPAQTRLQPRSREPGPSRSHARLRTCTRAHTHNTCTHAHAHTHAPTPADSYTCTLARALTHTQAHRPVHTRCGSLSPQRSLLHSPSLWPRLGGVLGSGRGSEDRSRIRGLCEGSRLRLGPGTSRPSAEAPAEQVIPSWSGAPAPHAGQGGGRCGGPAQLSGGVQASQRALGLDDVPGLSCSHAQDPRQGWGGAVTHQ